MLPLLFVSTSPRAEEMLDTPPDALEVRPFSMPALSEYTLSNGLTVKLVEDHEVPLVWLRLEFGAGKWSDPPGEEGLASVTMDMLDRRTQTLDERTLSKKKRRLACTVSTYAHRDGSTLAASSLASNLDETLDLVTEVLRQPAFHAGDLRGELKGRSDGLEKESLQPSTLCRRALLRVLYGDDYRGRAATKDSYAKIPAGNLRAWSNRHLHPGDAVLLVGGDTSMEQIVPLLEERLGDWGPREALDRPRLSPDQPATTTLYLMDLPGAVQSVVGVGRFVSPRTAPDYPALYLSDLSVGRLFSSRINMNLREDKGWTYDVDSEILDGYGAAVWWLWTSVETSTTTDALGELLGELRALGEDRPLTEQEVEKARGFGVHSVPAQFDDTTYLLWALAETWRYDLPDDWMWNHAARLGSVDAAAVNAAAVEHFDPDTLAIVVVGDMATVRETLQAFGLPTVDIDTHGDRIEDDSAQEEPEEDVCQAVGP